MLLKEPDYGNDHLLRYWHCDEVDEYYIASKKKHLKELRMVDFHLRRLPASFKDKHRSCRAMPLPPTPHPTRTPQHHLNKILLH